MDAEKRKEKEGMKDQSPDRAVTPSTRCTPSPFDRDTSRSSTPLRAPSALDRPYSRSSPLPRVTDGEAPIIDHYSDHAILLALLSLPRADQGQILANWAHRLERTRSCHILEQKIKRHCAKNAQVITRETSSQTEIVGSRDLGDASTDTLREGINQIKVQLDGAKEALNDIANGASVVRSQAREVHTSVFQTAAQAEVAAYITDKLIGSCIRTERRFSNAAGMELPEHLENKHQEALEQGDMRVHESPHAQTAAESSDEESNHDESRRGSKDSMVSR